jgi:hypothetical protein
MLMSVRYCPTIHHLNLLLTLLSSDSRSSGKDAQTLRHVPGMIILWDLARLLMEDVESDENRPPDRGLGEERAKKGVMRFKNG